MSDQQPSPTPPPYTAPPASPPPPAPAPYAAQPTMPPPPPYAAQPGGSANPVDLYWKIAPVRGRIVGGTYAGLGFLTFAASFLPFGSFFGESVSGVEGDGLFTLLLGVFLIGLGVVRLLGLKPGLMQLGWSGTAFAAAGLIVVIAFSIMLNIGDAGANVGFGLILTLLLGLALLVIASADLATLYSEVRSTAPQQIEPTVILVLGILSALGVSVFGPAAALMGGLTLQRMNQPGAVPDPRRNLVIAGLVCGCIGTLWLAIFSIVILASN